MNEQELNMYNIKLYNKNIHNDLDNPQYSNLQKIIYSNRVHDHNDMDKYLDNKLDLVKDLYTLKDVDKAGELIASRITKKSYICLVTDKDSDGICSAAVLYKSMQGIFGLIPDKDFKTFIAKRSEGNGITAKLLERILTHHNTVHRIDVIITADHASSDEYAISKLVEAGIEVVVTDHHEVPIGNYPKSATVFVNNQREDSHYSKNVSGCFVAFLTMLATYDKLYGSIDMNKFNFLLPYVALTTISDVMSLADPLNRKVVRVGLKEMNSLRDPLWYTLKGLLGINTHIDSTEIGFKIAPLINTANRVGFEDLSFELLIAESKEEIATITKQLLKLSTGRKEEQKKIYILAEQQMLDLPYKNSIVLDLESNLAINGIIAGQIGETNNKPTVCFISAPGDKIIAGSARGINPDFDVVEAFRNIAEEDSTILVKYGGHKQAAGCTVYKDKLEDFRRLFDKYVYVQLKDHKPVNHIYVDAYIPSKDITPALVKDISKLEPYGKDWHYPTFVSILKIKYIRLFGNMVMLTFKTIDTNREISGIYFFNKNSKYDKHTLLDNLDTNKPVVVVYKPYNNNFNNVTNLQLNVVDITNKE